MSDVPVSLGKIQQIIPVKYADVRNLINFLPRSSDIRIVTARQENMLVVTGTREQVTQVVRMVNVLDRPAMRGRFIGMLRLKYWSPEKMVVKLKEILAQEGIPVAARAGGNGVYFSTLERWGTLLFFAAEKEWLERIRYWASLLDVPLDRDEKRYFLYFPESSKATELAESLEKIIGVTTAHNRNEGLDRFKKPEKGASPKQGKASQKPLTAGTVPVTDGEVRISVDENRNALIIYAIPKKYAALELLLKKLDTMPLQVLLEASVVEVTLTDSLVVIGGGLSGASDLFLPKAVESLNRTFAKQKGGWVQRLETYAYNLHNPPCLSDFLMDESKKIKVPFTDELVDYSPIKKTGIGVSVLGTSEAVAKGAWEFALQKVG